MYSTCYVWSTSGNIGCFGCKDHLKKFTFSSFLPFNNIPLQRRSPKRTCFLVKRATIRNFCKITTMLDLYVIYFFGTGKISDLKKATFFCVFSRGLVGDPGSNRSIHVMTWPPKQGKPKNPSVFFGGETLVIHQGFKRKRHPRISYN